MLLKLLLFYGQLHYHLLYAHVGDDYMEAVFHSITCLLRKQFYISVSLCFIHINLSGYFLCQFLVLRFMYNMIFAIILLSLLIICLGFVADSNIAVIKKRLKA